MVDRSNMTCAQFAARVMLVLIVATRSACGLGGLTVENDPDRAEQMTDEYTYKKEEKRLSISFERRRWNIGLQISA